MQGASQLGAFAPFRTSPPAEFPPRLVPVWGTLLDAATRGMETYDSAGRPKETRPDAKDLESRSRRLLGSRPKTTEEQDRYTDLANALVTQWQEFELEHSEAAAAREEDLRAAREAIEEAKPKSTGERIGEGVGKALDTAQLVSIAVIIWALYKSFSTSGGSK